MGNVHDVIINVDSNCHSYSYPCTEIVQDQSLDKYVISVTH